MGFFKRNYVAHPLKTINNQGFGSALRSLHALATTDGRANAVLLREAVISLLFSLSIDYHLISRRLGSRRPHHDAGI